MKQAYFIAGTDTGIGKTHTACALLHAFRAQGLSAIGMKPVAAGVEADGENEDVRLLREASSIDVPKTLVNPYCLAEPIAPHVAAADEGVSIAAGPIIAALDELRRQADVVLVEGVGGLLVPLAEDFDAADLAVALGLPVILVVGMRLGCLNHALLTQEAIEARGLKLAGWIANRVDAQMRRFPENLATLENQLHAPLLGVIPHGVAGSEAVRHLNLPAA
jgi:dethiobiotin synthetase